jgi:CBS domain-containing protein
VQQRTGKNRKRVRQSIDQPNVESLMYRNFHAAFPDTPLHEVVDLLLKRDNPDIPLVTIDQVHGKLMGFISERDCVDYFSNEIFYANPDITANSVTKRSDIPPNITPQTDIFTAASEMVHHDKHFLPVFENGQLVGLLSRQTLLKGLQDFRNQSLALGEKATSSVDLSEIANHRFIVNG